VSESKTTTVGTPISLVEWLLTHKDPKPVDGIEGWFYSVLGPEITGNYWFEFSLRHRDGRELQFEEGVYTRFTTGTPWHVSFTWVIQKALSEVYPDEYEAPVDETADMYADRDWEPQIHIDNALGALMDRNIQGFADAVKEAARAMGAKNV
jgi:hypothetical protein